MKIQAPIQSGEVKVSDSPSVELRVDARKLRVLDPEVSEGTRAHIQDTCRGLGGRRELPVVLGLLGFGFRGYVKFDLDLVFDFYCASGHRDGRDAEVALFQHDVSAVMSAGA